MQDMDSLWWNSPANCTASPSLINISIRFWGFFCSFLHCYVRFSNHLKRTTFKIIVYWWQIMFWSEDHCKIFILCILILQTSSLISVHCWSLNASVCIWMRSLLTSIMWITKAQTNLSSTLSWKVCFNFYMVLRTC